MTAAPGLADGPRSPAGRWPDRLRAVGLGAAFLALGWLLVNQYSGGSRFGPFRDQLESFARAALAGDSATLRMLTTSEAPARWAVAAARGDTALLQSFLRKTEIVPGSHWGDTTVLLVYSAGVCVNRPFEITFVGRGRRSRIHQVRTDCTGR